MNRICNKTIIEKYRIERRNLMQARPHPEKVRGQPLEGREAFRCCQLLGCKKPVLVLVEGKGSGQHSDVVNYWAARNLCLYL